MAAKVGDVVFQASENVNGDDFWDDSALIKAYEKAVKSFKFQCGNELLQAHERDDKIRKKKKRKKRSKKNDYSINVVDKANRNLKIWNVGDKCQAAYSEDGLIYDAEIIEICSDVADMCVVQYCDYGNTEQQCLSDLIPLDDREVYNVSNFKQNGYSSDASTNESKTVNWKISDICVAPEPPNNHYHEAVINYFSSSLTCKVTFIRSRQSHEVKLTDIKKSSDLNLNTHFHEMFGNPSSTTTPINHFACYNKGTPRPPIPPPPPPISLDELQGDEESLASMLMSWYLSGYHTGYFKAVQEFKRKQNQNTPPKQTS